MIRISEKSWYKNCLENKNYTDHSKCMWIIEEKSSAEVQFLQHMFENKWCSTSPNRLFKILDSRKFPLYRATTFSKRWQEVLLSLISNGLCWSDVCFGFRLHTLVEFSSPYYLCWRASRIALYDSKTTA